MTVLTPCGWVASPSYAVLLVLDVSASKLLINVLDSLYVVAHSIML